MLNNLLKRTLGKELILYNHHRNSGPLASEVNRKRFIFFDPGKIWKATALVGRKTRLRYKLMYVILNIFNPVYIIDINWIDKLQSLYFVWCNNHARSFIVIQHGIYHGGIVQYIPEKYVKCNLFLVWGYHFKKMYEENNKGKSFKCISFGNPCYNVYDRSDFSYKHDAGNRILVAVSVIEGQRLQSLYSLLEKLEGFGFDITIKEHGMQMQKASVSINGYQKTSNNLYLLLKNQEYDIVITDVSSAMTDIIFFKNRAIYFSPEKAGSDLNQNIYSDFLENLAFHIEAINSRDALLKFVDIKAQENLLNYLIKTEDTSNDLSQLKDYLSEKQYV